MATLTLTWTHNDDVLSDTRVYLYRPRGSGDPPATENPDPGVEITFNQVSGGSASWVIPASLVGARLTLDFDVFYGGPRVLHVRQHFRIQAGGTGFAPDGTDGVWTQHPRITPPSNVRAGANPNVTLRLDTRFFDGTEMAPASLQGALSPGPGDPDTFSIRLLQQTEAHRPRVWAVVIPNRIPATTTDVQMLFFFSPIGAAGSRPANQTVASAVHLTLLQYVYPDNTPFAYCHQDAGQWAVRERPRFDMGLQLVRSGRSVILVFPYYSDAAHGSFSSTARGDGPRLIATARGILLTLWAEQRLGSGSTTSPRLTKLGLSGFSFGGGPALGTWGALRSSTSELSDLILFDPVPNSPIPPYSSFRGDLSSWGGQAGKRYQLFRGGQFEGSASYWEASRPYNEAWATGAGPAPQELAVAPASNPMTLQTGFSFTDASKRTIVTSALGTSRTIDVSDYAPIETSTFVGALTGHNTFRSIGGRPPRPFPVLAPPPLPPAMAATNFQRLHTVLDHSARSAFVAMAREKNRRHQRFTPEERLIGAYVDQTSPFSYRHQWALSGFDYDGATRKGHLQLALERSTFT